MIEQSQAGLASVTAQAAVEGAEDDARSQTPWRVTIGRILCVVVPIALWYAPLELEPAAKHALAITSFTIIAWITEALDHALTGLIGCYLYWALGVVKFNVAFSGFANDTAWFLFGAVLFGAMATKSGLARRLAFLVILRVGKTYPRILLGLILSDFLLTFLVPSGIARVVILGAVALGLMEAFGMSKGSNIGRGMFLILTYTAGIFDKMIIAGAASITARGLIERFGQVPVLWSKWFIAYLPCDLITIFVAWRLTLWLYPPEKEAISGGADHLVAGLKKMGSWSALEKKTAILMLIAVGLWMTDYLHHISPGHDRNRGRIIRRPAARRRAGDRGPQASQLPADLLRRSGGEYGRNAQRNEGSRYVDQCDVLLDAAVRDECLQLDARALLDGFHLSHFFGERSFYAGDLDSAADELRDLARTRSAGAGHGSGRLQPAAKFSFISRPS